MSVARKRGFTLIEALASVALIATGVAATVATLGAMARAQTRAGETEEMQRLALLKYDELLAVGSLDSGHAEGDFSDVGEKRFVWRADRVPTGDGNLDTVRVEISRKGDSSSKQSIQVRGLLCRPKQKVGG